MQCGQYFIAFEMLSDGFCSILQRQVTSEAHTELKKEWKSDIWMLLLKVNDSGGEHLNNVNTRAHLVERSSRIKV